MRIKWFSLVRITGLLLVLLYHFFQKVFPGGFIGVDIFFTFSGFLITALLIDEFAFRAKEAKEMGFDYFCTTLSISPLKDAQKINAIGQSVGEQYGVAWLPSDFKKQERYKRSIALSREYGLYRQNFCGCVYSKQEKEKPV